METLGGAQNPFQEGLEVQLPPWASIESWNAFLKLHPISNPEFRDGAGGGEVGRGGGGGQAGLQSAIWCRRRPGQFASQLIAQFHSLQHLLP